MASLNEFANKQQHYLIRKMTNVQYLTTGFRMQSILVGFSSYLTFYYYHCTEILFFLKASNLVICYHFMGLGAMMVLGPMFLSELDSSLGEFRSSWCPRSNEKQQKQKKRERFWLHYYLG